MAVRFMDTAGTHCRLEASLEGACTSGGDSSTPHHPLHENTRRAMSDALFGILTETSWHKVILLCCSKLVESTQLATYPRPLALIRDVNGKTSTIACTMSAATREPYRGSCNSSIYMHVCQHTIGAIDGPKEVGLNYLSACLTSCHSHTVVRPCKHYTHA